MAIKQIIVMRTRYPDGKGGTMKVRTGKLIAQGCHASMKTLFDQMATIQECGYPCFITKNDAADKNWQNLFIPWLTGIFTKIVVYVETEQELRDIYQKALDAKLPCSLIEDNGLTEFHGIKTCTAVAVGPAQEEDLKPITGHLPLL